MNSEEFETMQPESKSYAGMIGFTLALGGLLSFGLTAIPGFIYSVAGLFKKGSRGFAVAGLIISSGLLYFLSTFLTAFFPPGTIPQPLQRIIYSPGSFWLGYDPANLVDSNFHGSKFGGGSGWIYFKSDKPGTYTVDKAISFAEKNGWVYHGKTEVETRFFKDYFKDGRLDHDKNFDESVLVLWGMYLSYFQYIPFEIQRDCTILVFEAPKPHYIIISSDGKEMEVRIVTIHFPDPPLEIPEEFKK